jgi:hypothetical protein
MEFNNQVNTDFEQPVNKPCLTHDQFTTLTKVNGRIIELKQSGFDIIERLDAVKTDINELESLLEKIKAELADRKQEMEKYFNDYIYEPYSISGQISIADTEPHYITVVE